MLGSYATLCSAWDSHSLFIRAHSILEGTIASNARMKSISNAASG